MSPTALRWCAVPLGVLGFILRLAVTFRLQPLTWRLGLDYGLSVMLGGIAVAVAVPFGILWLLAGSNLRPPASFVVGDGRFTAQASPMFASSQAILWMILSGGLVVTERVPNGDAMRVAEFGFAWPMTIIDVGLFWAGALAFLLVHRPQLHLDPSGLTIHRMWSTTVVAWDELAPGGPPPPTKRHPRKLRLYLNRMSTYGQYVASEDVPVGRLHIDPAFLANAIHHYVDNPQDRATIGSGVRQPVHEGSS